MNTVFHSRKGKFFLSLLILLVFAPPFRAQTAEKKPLLEFASPLKVELSQRMDLWDPRGKFSTDLWKFSGGGKSFSFDYSNQPLGVIAGKQFQLLPGGYELARFSSQRGWGKLHAFQTTGHNVRAVAPSLARRLSGGALEVPKFFLGTRLGAFLLHSRPDDGGVSKSAGTLAPPANQLGFSLARDFKKGFKLESEWSQSSRPFRKSQAASVPGNQALFVKLSGTVARSEGNFIFRSQSRDFINPAIPLPQLGRDLVAMDARRTFKKLEVQYARNQDRLRRSPSFPGQSVSNQLLRGTFTPKLWPQLTAAHTRTDQVAIGSRFIEDNLRFGVRKGLKKVHLDVAYLRGTRIDNLMFRTLWERTGIVSDASVEVLPGKRLNLHYEASALSIPSASDVLHAQILQMNTRLSWLKDKLALVPALDYREQRGTRGGAQYAFLNFVLTSLIKLPRYVPGTELLVTFSSRHASTIGQPDQNLARFLIQWNFKRL